MTRLALPGVAAFAALLVGCSCSRKPTEDPVQSSVVTVGLPPHEPRPGPSAPLPFSAPGEVRSSAYHLTWSVNISAGAPGHDERILMLEYQVKAFEELYIADRLWDDDAKKHRVPDPFGVYRFVQNGSLRLVFAAAPYPPNIKIGNTYQPLYSRILAGETRRKTVQIKLPVDEYSSLERDVNAPSVVKEVSRVFFVLSYRLRSTMDRAPAAPLTEPAEDVGYLVPGPKELMIQERQVDRLPVKRRTGYMARFPLPGESGPEPIPIELLR